jgi:hypothetical protein
MNTCVLAPGTLTCGYEWPAEKCDLGTQIKTISALKLKVVLHSRKLVLNIRKIILLPSPKYTCTHLNREPV